MTTTFDDRQSLLLAEASKLNKTKKEIEDRLKEIKKDFGPLAKGKYKNNAGDELTISETLKFTEISSRTLFDYLKRNKLMTHFPSLVKVQLTPLKKVVPETVYSKWRKPLDSIMRWNFR